MALKARWKGRRPDEDGFEFLQGVPSRDLEDEEFEALSDDQKAAVLSTTRLYTVRGARSEREALPEGAVQSPAATELVTMSETPGTRRRSTERGGE